MTNTPFDDQPVPTNPIPNVPLLRKVRGHIGAHPEEWDQTEWRLVSPCGTTCCFAGWAAHFDGAEWLDDLGINAAVAGESGCGIEMVSARAQRALGLTGTEAETLFWFGNRLTNIDDQLAAIYARAGEDG